MSQKVDVPDLIVGVKQMIEDGPNKWDLIVAFADSTQKGTTVDFQIVVFRDSFPVGTTIKVWISTLEQGGNDGHQWNFVGRAIVNVDHEVFRVRGFYNARTRDGHVSRITT